MVSVRGLSARAAGLVAALTVVGFGLAAQSAWADTTVSTFADLQAAFAAGGTVVLGQDLTAPSGQNLAVGATPVVLDLNGHSLRITSPGDFNAAVSVPSGHSLTIESGTPGGSLTATGGVYGAGIGSPQNDAGTVIITGGTVSATGGQGAAGIGGGIAGGGGSVTITGGTVSATGGADGAGIGGGYNGNGGTVTITGGTVSATGGEGGAGIGGGLSGDGVHGAGGTVSIGADASVTVADIDGLADPVGFGFPAAGPVPGFGSLSNAGTLTVPAGYQEYVPAGVTVENSGTLDLAGSLLGGGTVHNTGAIVVESGGSVAGNGQGSGDVLVSDHNYTLTFTNGDTALTDDTMHVYAATVTDSGQSLPAGPTAPSGEAFAGWFTAASGGTQVTDSTDLSTLADSGPVTVPLYAHFITACTTTITTPHRGLAVAGGTTCVIGTTIKGGITVVDGANLDLENAKVTGSITAHSPGSLRVCGSTSGGIAVTGASGLVVIGDPANSCTGNVIKGGLTATGNTGGGTVSGNKISGTWKITRNAPAFIVTGNHH